jgi:hypothetical protein
MRSRNRGGSWSIVITINLIEAVVLYVIVDCFHQYWICAIFVIVTIVVLVVILIITEFNITLPM